MSGDRQRAPARVKQSAPAAGQLPGDTRTILTPRGVVTVGTTHHVLDRDDIVAAYRGGILFDPVEIEAPKR